MGMRRIGVLAPSTRAKEEVILKPFFDEMHRLGWIEGRTIVYDRVYANDRHQELPKLAAEMVARKPELIYAPPQIAALAAKQATQTIPIVFGTGPDPVRSALVTSLARPGGNVTGAVQSADSLAPKRVELLREILPGVRRLGLIGDPADPRFAGDRDALVPAASALGMTVVLGEVSNESELDATVGKLIASRVEAILAVTTIISNLRDRIITLANANRIPVIGANEPLAESGALFAYGASVNGQLRRSAQLVDKVLKGTKPANIPVEQPTTYELVINLKAAKGLGIVVPQSLVNRADRVIQ
jgi:putative ABC transport system substrate-binding protein